MKIIAFLIILILSLTSCGIGTIRDTVIKDKDFQTQNLPIRELRVVLYLNPNSFNDEGNARELIRRASQDTFDQAGISLKIIMVRYISLKSYDDVFTEMNRELRHKLDYWKKFDIAIAFLESTPLESLKINFIGGKLAEIEDYYRRLVIVKEINLYILEHEIWHAFIFSHAHSVSGILSPILLRMVPFTPAIPIGGLRITPGQREEVLRNKWRDFSKKADVKEN